MANIKIIKRRIKSAQNISQITKAMEMVAASKMKKAQLSAILGKPYAEKIYEVVKELAKRTDKKYHQLLKTGNKNGKTLVILISTNKGLCGGLNTVLFRQVINWYKDVPNVEFVTLGKKSENFVVRSNNCLVADFSDIIPFTNSVGAVTKLFVDGFLEGIYKEIHIVFNTFISAMKQAPTRKILLPISTLDN
jgi:F-type H+-transporting ATPase subunit gamma